MLSYLTQSLQKNLFENFFESNQIGQFSPLWWYRPRLPFAKWTQKGGVRLQNFILTPPFMWDFIIYSFFNRYTFLMSWDFTNQIFFFMQQKGVKPIWFVPNLRKTLYLWVGNYYKNSLFLFKFFYVVWNWHHDTPQKKSVITERFMYILYYSEWAYEYEDHTPYSLGY